MDDNQLARQLNALGAGLAKLVDAAPDEREKALAVVGRLDSYTNLVSQIGTLLDKSEHTTFLRRPDLPKQVLDDLYEQDAMVARVVDRLPDDATREGVIVKSDTNTDGLASVMQDLAMLKELSDAWRWGRLYGGALLLMVVNDGLPMDMPLDLANATELSALNVIESPYVQPDGFNPGLGARAFRNPTHYNVVLDFGAGGTKKIHRTRVIRFDGMRVAPSRTISNGGWPPGVIDRIFNAFRRLGSSEGHAENILHEVSLIVLQIEGLRNSLAGNDGDKQAARDAVEALKWNASSNNILALDAKDSLMDFNRSVTGVCDLLDKFVDAAVRATDMPRTVLLGEQPGGLNANGESEIRSWYDFVQSQQEAVLTPALTRLLTVLFATWRNNNIPAPDKFTIEYLPLWQPTGKEKGETLKAMAEALQILIQSGIISADEGRAMLIEAEMITPLESPVDGGVT